MRPVRSQFIRSRDNPKFVKDYKTSVVQKGFSHKNNVVIVAIIY